jgi:dTDP-4-dehydrorhamnose reductase
MRLVVTGAGGGLARALLESVPPHHDVHAFAHADLDVGDYHAVMQTMVPLVPDAILNLAAMARVDECERHPDRAYRGNAVGPQNLALAARQVPATLLHVSTDYVFDGEKGSPYDEVDVPNPLSVYGRSKLAGETFVRDLHAEHFIVRTAWLYGTEWDFLSRALPTIAAGEPATAVADRIGSPTFVRHLAERLLPLIVTGRYGTYHLAGPDPVSWHEALTRLKALGALPGEVRPVSAAELGLPARRPRRSDLTSLFVGELELDPMPPLDVGLKELVDERRG